jgi:hypothetical protein
MLTALASPRDVARAGAVSATALFAGSGSSARSYTRVSARASVLMRARRANPAFASRAYQLVTREMRSLCSASRRTSRNRDRARLACSVHTRSSAKRTQESEGNQHMSNTIALQTIDSVDLNNVTGGDLQGIVDGGKRIAESTGLWAGGGAGLGGAIGLGVGGPPGAATGAAIGGGLGGAFGFGYGVGNEIGRAIWGAPKQQPQGK